MRSPAWIAAALEDGSIAADIGTSVQVQALAFVRRLLDAARPDAKVAVNVSSSELRRPGWAIDFLKRIAEARVPSSSIEVEVTESVLLGHAARHTLRSLRVLHEAGVRISLDDFGTGFASLSHLRSCPVDALKIDRSFIRNLWDPEARAIVRSIIELGRTLHMVVVAEGIETAQQHWLLKSLGCLQAQGYLYARPSPPRRWLKPTPQLELKPC
jgi:EAL domain-containing protein (putative c-di-GMP-specific phosphodiesterase class I)